MVVDLYSGRMHRNQLLGASKLFECPRSGPAGDAKARRRGGSGLRLADRRGRKNKQQSHGSHVRMLTPCRDLEQHASCFLCALAGESSPKLVSPRLTCAAPAADERDGGGESTDGDAADRWRGRKPPPHRTSQAKAQRSRSRSTSTHAPTRPSQRCARG